MTMRFCAAAFALALATACGGSVESTANTGAGGVTANGGAGGATAGGGASQGGTAGSSLGGLDFQVEDESDQPIAGALVVVDLPDGTREQMPTDAAGIAIFPDVDFSAGPLDVTAFDPGRILASVLGIDATSSRVIHLSRRMLPSFPRPLDVSVVNQLDPSDNVFVYLTVPERGADGPAGAFHFTIAEGATGKVIAIELSGPPPQSLVSAVAVDIPSSGNSVVVDLSKPEPIEKIWGGTIQLPAPGSGGVDFDVQSLRVRVDGVDPQAFFCAGVGTDFTPSASGVDFEAEFFRPLPESEVRTWYSAEGYSAGGAEAYSAVVEPGYPPGTPPPLPSAASLTVDGYPAFLFDPMHWSAGTERPDQFVVSASWGASGFPVWIIWFPADRDTLTLRRPPDEIWNQLDWTDGTAEMIFGGLSYCEPSPGACAGYTCSAPLEAACSRSAGSVTSFTLTAP
jgi:hypothetical protein